MKTLDRYLLREALAHFSLGLGVIVLLFLAGAVYEVLAPLVAKGADPYTLLRYLLYRTPEALVRGAPVAYLFALLFLLSRLAEDSELKALLALGIRRERVLLPFLALGGFWPFWASSWGKAWCPKPWRRGRTSSAGRCWKSPGPFSPRAPPSRTPRVGWSTWGRWRGIGSES